MSLSVMLYGSTAISVPVDVLFRRTAASGERHRISVSDSAVETLIARLDNDEWISVSRPGSYRQLLSGMFIQAQSAVSGLSIGPGPIVATEETSQGAPDRGSPVVLLQLVEKWLGEDNGYDAAAWPVIQEDIEEYRLSDRDRFHD